MSNPRPPQAVTERTRSYAGRLLHVIVRRGGRALFSRPAERPPPRPPFAGIKRFSSLSANPKLSAVDGFLGWINVSLTSLSPTATDTVLRSIPVTWEGQVQIGDRESRKQHPGDITVGLCHWMSAFGGSNG